MANEIDPSQVASIDEIDPNEVDSVQEERSEAAPSKAQSFSRGLAQGATLSWGDEIAAAMDTAFQGNNPVAKAVQATREFLGPLGRRTTTPLTIKKTYEQRRDEERAQDSSARAENPGSYFGGTLLGAVATPVPIRGGGLGGAITRGAALGGIAGAGASTGGLGDTLKGGLEGAVAGGVTGGALNAAGRMFADRAAALSNRQELARQALQQYFGKQAPAQAPATTVHVPVVSHGIEMAGQAVDKGTQLLRRVIDSAKSGNVRAQGMLDALASTPDGAAKIAGVMAGEHADNSGIE